MVDITGKKFGRLTALKHHHSVNYGSTTIHYWETVCECGNTKICAYDNLVKGDILSCGCLRKETRRQHMKNEFYTESKLYSTNLPKLRHQSIQRNNSTGVTGVSRVKKTGKFIAKIGCKKEIIYLGVFDSLEAAKKARDEAYEKYHLPILEEAGFTSPPSITKKKIGNLRELRAYRDCAFANNDEPCWCIQDGELITCVMLTQSERKTCCHLSLTGEINLWLDGKIDKNELIRKLKIRETENTNGQH